MGKREDQAAELMTVVGWLAGIVPGLECTAREDGEWFELRWTAGGDVRRCLGRARAVRDFAVAKWRAHEPDPRHPYVTEGAYVGKPARLPYRGDSAAEALCGTCHQMVRCAGDGRPWVHTGRRPGEPGRAVG